MSESVAPVQSLAQALKVPEGSVVDLRGASISPRHLDFVGLMRAGAQQELVPDAVVMHDEQPFIYVLAEPTGALAADRLQQAMQRLALRSDAPYVATVRPGAVRVYALSAVREERPPVLEANQLDRGVLARLIVGDLPAARREALSSTHDMMLELLNAVNEHLVRVRNVVPQVALALVGRALFMRFLVDRRIVPKAHPYEGVADVLECFSSPPAAAATCRWLDETFNGDLLELPDHGSLAYFVELDSRAQGSSLVDLSAIMYGDKPVGDGMYQGRFKWNDLHFSYLPVGLLSQVYEAFAHRFATTDAKSQSVYYTPRHLAEYMVDRAMAMLGADAHQARILDPASGGGVFLLAAFRRLVRARWERTGEQPQTDEIRHILNHQLVGFDINPAARQLSALALYLTAIELDPQAHTLQNLKFEVLQGSVLMPAEEWTDPSGLSLGSLSSQAGETFSGVFDLVVGNPPWTSVSNPERSKAYDALTTQCMRARGLDPVRNPDNLPDLPFVWAATYFAKPDGVIAFALHGRLLTKLSPQGHAVRQRIFQGLDVDYVLNGLELRNTPVWPSMQAHFCLLFARNRLPGPDSQFFAVTPLEDRSLNREGRVRIDSKDAWASDSTMVEKVPHLFKTLAKGNALDVELLERIEAKEFPSLSAYINSERVQSGHGYRLVQKDTSGEEPGFLTTLRAMPEPPSASWRLVPIHALPFFQSGNVDRRRSREIYRAPLVLLREAPSSQVGRPQAILGFEDVAYRESYIGFSLAETEHGVRKAVYLAALFNSPLFLYFMLMTSSKFGCERSALQQDDVGRLPVRPYDQLDSGQLDQLAQIEQAVRADDEQRAATLEVALVRDIYGLRSADWTLIEDRLACALPFKDVRVKAAAAPGPDSVQLFERTLATGLAPFDMSVTETCVEVLSYDATSPWRFLRIGPKSQGTPLKAQHLLAAIAITDELDFSLVEIPHEESLYIGLLNQQRFWTRTAARTLALDLIKRGDKVLARGTPCLN